MSMALVALLLLLRITEPGHALFRPNVIWPANFH